MNDDKHTISALLGDWVIKLDEEAIEAGQAAGAVLRDEALERVEDGAGPGWMAAAAVTIRAYAATHETLCSDELWSLLPPCSEKRAIGAAMKTAQREHVIAPTDAFRPSSLASSHKCPRRIWRSLVYTGAPKP